MVSSTEGSGCGQAIKGRDRDFRAVHGSLRCGSRGSRADQHDESAGANAVSTTPGQPGGTWGNRTADSRSGAGFRRSERGIPVVQLPPRAPPKPPGLTWGLSPSPDLVIVMLRWSGNTWDNRGAMGPRRGDLMQTWLTQRLGIELPLVQAPMARVSEGPLASAVSEAARARACCCTHPPPRRTWWPCSPGPGSLCARSADLASGQRRLVRVCARVSGRRSHGK